MFRYFAPEDGDLESIIEHIEAMPYSEAPEIFGL